MTGPYGSAGEPQMPPPEPLPPYWSGPQPAYPAGQWPAPPPRRTPVWAWLLIAAAVVVVGLGVVGFVARGGDSASPKDAAGTGGRTLRAPARVGDYTTVTSVDREQLADQFRGQLGPIGWSDAVNHAEIGLYGRSEVPKILFIGFELADVPDLRNQVADEGVRASVEQFSEGISGGAGRVGGSVSSAVHSVDPGPLGGFMRCGGVLASGQEVGVCAWGDRSAMAMTIVLNPGSDAETARLTVALRAAAER